MPESLPENLPDNILSQLGDNSIELRDIHLPDSIHWWPIAPAWWILFAIISLLLVGIAYYWWKKTRSSQIRSIAQAEYDQIINTSSENSSIRFNEMLILLKKISKTLPQVETFLSKEPEIWLEKLSQVLQTDQVSNELIRNIKTIPYQVVSTVETREIDLFTQKVIDALPENTKDYSINTSVIES